MSQCPEPPHQVCISHATVASHCPFSPSARGPLPLVADLLLCERFFFPISSMFLHCLPCIHESGVTHSFAARSGKKCIYNTRRFSHRYTRPLPPAWGCAVQTHSMSCCTTHPSSRVRKHLTPVLTQVIWSRCCCFCNLIFCISMHIKPASSQPVGLNHHLVVNTHAKIHNPLKLVG